MGNILDNIFGNNNNSYYMPSRCNNALGPYPGMSESWYTKGQRARPIHKNIPSVNPNAVNIGRTVGSLIQTSKYNYIPNHRNVVEIPPSFTTHNSVTPQRGMYLPVDARKLNAYQSYVEDERIRRSMGINIVPS